MRFAEEGSVPADESGQGRYAETWTPAEEGRNLDDLRDLRRVGWRPDRDPITRGRDRRGFAHAKPRQEPRPSRGRYGVETRSRVGLEFDL